ncbi:GNAT family N-acetyltransferase [Planktotalea sp.]|uniref:GNAT family N-acetyltransferase n=1 Tax=Planktotalea sp. TaxID=2029877 RepID=UPI003F6AD64E
MQNWRVALEDAQERTALERDLVNMLTPRVVEFLPPQLALGDGKSAISDWIKERKDAALIYTVRMYHSKELQGLLFLMDQSDGKTNAFSIGYMFKEAAWGHGYASELVAGVIAQSQHVILRGGVAKGNDASVRVLIKNGFQVCEDLSTADVAMFERHL